MRLLSAFDGFTGRFVFDFAAVREARLGEDFVIPVDRQLALAERRLEKVEQIARVHLAGVVPQLRRKIDRADDPDSLMLDDLSCARELAVATLLRGNIYNDRPGSHSLDHRTANELRGRTPGYRGGGYNRVDRRDTRIEHFLLLALLFLR